MNILSRYLIEPVTFWEALSSTKDGWFTFQAPIRILCRWEDSKTLFTDADGNETVSRGAIITLGEKFGIFPKEYIFPKIHDFFFRGESTEADPKDVEFAYEVREIVRSESLNRKLYLYTAIV